MAPPPITVTQSFPSPTVSVPSDEAMTLYVARFYTQAIDAILEAPETIQVVLNALLLKKLPLSGFVSALVQNVIGPSNERGEAQNPDILDWSTLRGRNDDLGVSTSGTHLSRKPPTVDEMLNDVTSEVVSSATRTVPDYQHLFLHWLLFDSSHAILGFFRIQHPTTGLGAFTDGERELLDTLAPYLAQIIQLDTVFKAGQSGYGFFRRRTIELAEQFGLTAAEYRILHGLITGAENVTIAGEMGISVSTVKTHITHILQKTNCRNRNALLRHYFNDIS